MTRELRDTVLRRCGNLLFGIAMLVVSITVLSNTAWGQLTYSLVKSVDSTVVQSGQQFTFTLSYSISGTGTAAVSIVDTVPAGLVVINTAPTATVTGTYLTGSIVTFNLGTMTGGSSGVVQINVKFKEGETCDSMRVCNKAWIGGGQGDKPTPSNQVCVTARAKVRFTIEKQYYSGNIINGSTTYWIYVKNPNGGDIGGLNINNLVLRDYLPPGAVATAATGNFFSLSQSGNVVTLTGSTQFNVYQAQIYYGTLVTVTYPSNIFSTGQVVCDTAALSYKTPCDTATRTMSDTSCVMLQAPNPQGQFAKLLFVNPYFWGGNQYLPSFTPGCCGDYGLQFYNSGNVALNNVVIADSLPKVVTVKELRTTTYPGGGQVNLEFITYNTSSNTWSAWTQAPGFPQACTSYGTILSTPTTLGLGANDQLTQVRWTYTTVPTPTPYITNHIEFQILNNDFVSGAPVVTGQNVINTATAQGTNLGLLTAVHQKQIEPASPKISALKLQVPNCQIPNGNASSGPYFPGQTARWRICVTNIGNVNAINAVITDNLPTYLTYAGNETYYYGALFTPPYYYSPNPAQPLCGSFSSIPPTQIGGSIVSPTIGQQNLTWTFPQLPFRCDGLLDYFIIEFDVKIEDTPLMAPAGQYPNQFTFTASNYTSGMTSNIATLTVNSVPSMTCSKSVKLGSDTTWSTNATITAGNTADYRLRIKNTGNIPLSNIKIIDILPHVGDIRVLPVYSPRNSQYDITVSSPLTVTPSGASVTGNTATPVKNPLRSTEFQCVSSDPGGAGAATWSSTFTGAYAVKIDYGTGLTVPANGTVDVFFSVTVPATAKQDSVACNSFGLQATPINSATPLCATEANLACITIDTPTVTCKCGSWRSILLDGGGAAPLQLSCGKSYNVNCKTNYTFSASYFCAGSCDPTYVVTTTNPAGNTNTQTFIGSISKPVTFNQNGTYTLNIKVYCNGQLCEDCRIQFVVTDCKCDCIGWESLQLTTNNTKTDLQCGSIVSVSDCHQTYQINGLFQCASNCASSYVVSITDPSGAQVFSQTQTTLNVPIYFTQNGSYIVSIIPKCGDSACTPCEIVFNVDCFGSDCCGKWESLIARPANGNPITLKCGGIYQMKCNSLYTIAGNYICKQPCTPKYEVTIHDPLGVATTTTSTTLNQPFTFTQNGSYTILIKVYCNGKLCNECQLTIRVTDCKCDCGKWINLAAVYQGKNLAAGISQQLACGSVYDAACDKPYSLIGSFQCQGDCDPTFTISSTDPKGNVSTQTQFGSMNYPLTFQYNGTHTVTVTVKCGTKVCSECTMRFVCQGLGVGELETAKQVSIFPNPSTGDGYIRLPDKTVTYKMKIANALGSVIETTSVRGETVKLSGDKYASGTYIIELTGKDGRYIGVWVKTR